MKNVCPLATGNHLFAHQGHLPQALGAINPALILLEVTGPEARPWQKEWEKDLLHVLSARSASQTPASTFRAFATLLGGWRVHTLVAALKTKTRQASLPLTARGLWSVIHSYRLQLSLEHRQANRLPCE